ncbi:MAG: hypothetical protein IJK23_06220 [Clostridia bacterium]|nr:hypothetical protein [Clostridia bacterium]
MILVSILGDSLSTFEGFNPVGYAVYYNQQMQMRNELKDVYDTWWAMVNQQMHAFLCVNNSYSGSRVSGPGFPAASCPERISGLRTNEYSPDYILVYIGFNDFGNGVKISNGRFGSFSDKSGICFEESYELMLDRLKEQYPAAVIICGTLMRTKMKYDESWSFPEKFAGVDFEDYNNAIRRAVTKKRVFLADLSALNIRYETLDGSHPTKEGHRTIAAAWLKCFADLNILSI